MGGPRSTRTWRASRPAGPASWPATFGRGRFRARTASRGTTSPPRTLSAHYIQAESARLRLEYTAQVGDEVERLLARAGLPDRAAVSLTNAVLGVRIHNAAYRREADVSQVVASRDLSVLSTAGLLTPIGEKRGRYYVAAPPLVALRSRKRSERIRDPFELLGSA